MLFCCKSLRFANFLISKGARLIRIDRDKLVRDRLVFIFQNSELITNCQNEWAASEQPLLKEVGASIKRSPD
jgi:hypothetical protein